jgi:hypothetical protein
VLPPDLAEELAAAGVEVADLLAGVRVLGIVMALLAAVYIVLAVMAHRGVNGARITIAVLTSIFVLFLLLGALGGGATDPVGLLFGLSVAAASVGGTVLFFAPAASAWFSAKR